MRRWLLMQLGIAATAAGITLAALFITIVGVGHWERAHRAHRVITVSQK